MAYDTSNPPQFVSSGVAGKDKVWMYKSLDDETAFDDAGYITNAGELGMQTGDIVHVIDTTNGLASIAQVTVASDGKGTLSALTAVT